jgi:hypothetical protein
VALATNLASHAPTVESDDVASRAVVANTGSLEAGGLSAAGREAHTP